MHINDNIIRDINKNNVNFKLNEVLFEAERLFNDYFDVKAENRTASFSNNIWKFNDLISNNTYKFDFDSFIPLISFNKEINSKEFILILKCWVINNLNLMSPAISFKQFSNLKSIFHYTKGLRTNLDKLIEIVKNNQVYTKVNSKQYTIKTVRPETTKRYANSLIGFSRFYNVLPIDKNFLIELSSMANTLKFSGVSRALPDLSELLNFKDCIEEYYRELMNNEKTRKKELIEFYPIFLWWDLTTIIPMRPSEFCMIERNCISGNKITFPRLKQRRKSPNSRKNRIYDTISIPAEIINKIQHYKKLTDKYGDSKYLISFNAFKSLSLKRIKNNVDYDNKHFTNHYLAKLINKFYEEIVTNKYKLTVTKHIRPGDLRHISIMSMMMQGYDRVEIERLAGHFDVNSQFSYVEHMHYWVDTEIQALSNQFTFYNKNDFRSPQAVELFDKIHDDLIYTEISQNDSSNHEYIKLKLGYCKDITMPCPSFNWDYTGCYFCENWGITLSELNQNKELIIKELSKSHNELHRKINYLAGLYNLHQLDNNGHINQEIVTELKITTEEIKQNKKTVATLYHLVGGDSHEQ